jgi:hypothetical protein
MKIPRRFFLSCLFSVSSLGMVHATQPDFGPNVLIFDPGMPASKIQAALNQVPQQQVSNQFGSQRYAFLFSLGGVGTIEHVMNDTGGTANTSNQVVDLVSYP